MSAHVDEALVPHLLLSPVIHSQQSATLKASAILHSLLVCQLPHGDN